jgi:hypothetical protein
LGRADEPIEHAPNGFDSPNRQKGTRQNLRRRVKVRPFNDSFEMFAIGPEDFIVNKLARGDRGVQDEQDAVSVLAMQKNKLDYPYLKKRAKQAGVAAFLETLMQKSRTSP